MLVLTHSQEVPMLQRKPAEDRKTDIVEALLRLAEAWQQALAANTTPKDRLRALIAAQLRQIEATPALPAILHSREINVDNVIMRERFRGLMMQYQAHLV